MAKQVIEPEQVTRLDDAEWNDIDFSHAYPPPYDFSYCGIPCNGQRLYQQPTKPLCAICLALMKEHE